MDANIEAGKLDAVLILQANNSSKQQISLVVFELSLVLMNSDDIKHVEVCFHSSTSYFPFSEYISD